MILRSYLVWVSLWVVACRTIASPALQNLAFHVPDQVKSVTMFISTVGALIVTYKISKNSEDKALFHKVKQKFVLITTILMVLDAVVIIHGDPIWKYVFENLNDKIIIPFFGMMYIELRAQEAKRLNIEFSSWFLKLEFPKCLTITIAGLLAIWIYQPERGLTVDQGMWLMWGGGAIADAAVAFNLLKNRS